MIPGDMRIDEVQVAGTWHAVSTFTMDSSIPSRILCALCRQDAGFEQQGVQDHGQVQLHTDLHLTRLPMSS